MKHLTLVLKGAYATPVGTLVDGLGGFKASIEGDTLTLTIDRVERANGPFDGSFSDKDFGLLLPSLALLSTLENVKPAKGWSGDGAKDWKRISGSIRAIVKSGHPALKANRSMGPNSTMVQHLLSTVIRGGKPITTQSDVDTSKVKLDF